MSNAVKTNKRILALDILRGVTIAGMIMVNNPGTYLRPLAPCGMERPYPHRPCVPFLYVHHGDFHVHFFEEI